MDHLYVKDISRLQLHIYVLGYYPMGESILVIVYDEIEHIARKSLLIDCFENNGINQMESILNEYKIDEINWILLFGLILTMIIRSDFLL